MATTTTTEKKVKVTFDADGTPLKKTVTEVEKTVNKVGDAIRQAENGASQSGGIFGKFGADVKQGFAMGFGMSTVDMVTNAIGLVKDGIADAIQTTAEFEQSMANVQAVTGATGKEFDTLTNFARELGKTTMMSANESAEAMSFLGMAGWNTSEIMAGLPAILDLTVASGKDFASVADIVSDNLTAFGMTAQDAGKYSDALAYAMSHANVNMDTLGESLKYIAPVAESAGVSMEDAVAMTMMLGDAGIKGSQAGTTLRTVMLNLTGANEKATQTLKDLGVEVFDSQGKTRKFSDIIRDLDKSMEGMTDAQKTATLNTLVGKTAVSGFSAILAQGADKLDAYVEGIENSNGASAEMAEIMGNTLEGKTKLFNSALDELKITMTDAFLPALTGGIELLTGFVNGMTNLANPTAIANENLGVFGVSLDEVSEKTSNMLQPLADVSESVSTNAEVFKHFGSVASETYGQMVLDVQNWKDTSISIIDQKEKEGLDLIKNYSQEYLNASDEEKKALEEKVTSFYENKKSMTENWENEITEIVNGAKEKNVALTQEQSDRIKTIMSLQQKEMTKVVSSSYNEQQALLDAFKATEKTLTADTAQLIISKAGETRDKVKSSAKERLDKELEVANEMRKVGAKSKAEYEKMVQDATTNYNAIVKESETGFNKVKDNIIKSITEAGGTYNKNTGELRDAHGKLVDYLAKTPGKTEIKVDKKQAESAITSIKDQLKNIKDKTVKVTINKETVTKTRKEGDLLSLGLNTLSPMASGLTALSPMTRDTINTINYNGDMVFNKASDIDYFMKQTARAIERRY